MVKHQGAEELNFINFGGERVRGGAVCLTKPASVPEERGVSFSCSPATVMVRRLCGRDMCAAHAMCEAWQNIGGAFHQHWNGPQKVPVGSWQAWHDDPVSLPGARVAVARFVDPYVM